MSDFKEYKTIELTNGLRVLLISDQQKNNSKTNSAAAMSVNAGFYQEPFEYPGLAHFLEHMVFMGSGKYPNENYFDEFISSRNGQTNAFTDAEMTMYFVEIEKNSFEKLLDIWSRFFIDPLLSTDSINREIQAVDSEFKLARTRDDFRIQGMLVDLARRDHPASKFGMGNMQSLKKTNSTFVDVPLSLYSELSKFHKRFYNAKNMNLVLQSNEPIQKLQEMAVKYFGIIPNRDESSDPMTGLTPFVEKIDTWSEMYGNVYEVIPTGNQNLLIVLFQLPPNKGNYKVDGLGYISWLIGHEADGSILHQLQLEGLAISLFSSVSKNDGEANNKLFSSLKITVILTDSGAERYDTVLDVIFSYLELMSALGPQNYIQVEINNERKIAWATKEQTAPIENVVDLAEKMANFPNAPKRWLDVDFFQSEFDSNEIRDKLNLLTLDRAQLGNLVFEHHEIG